MKKNLKIIGIFISFIALAGNGCGSEGNKEELSQKIESVMASVESEKKNVTAQVLDVVPCDICFTFPDDWEDITSDSPFDLQMKNHDRYYCSIFGFKDIDLSHDMTPEDIFELQKEDLFSKRDFMELISKEPILEDENRKIYRELYSGEKDGRKYYYYCCMIDFKEPAEGFAWVIFSGSPSWIENDIENINEILISAEYKGN